MTLSNGEKVFEYDTLVIYPDDEIEEKPRFGIHYYFLKNMNMRFHDISIVEDGDFTFVEHYKK